MASLWQLVLVRPSQGLHPNSSGRLQKRIPLVHLDGRFTKNIFLKLNPSACGKLSVKALNVEPNGSWVRCLLPLT